MLVRRGSERTCAWWWELTTTGASAVDYIHGTGPRAPAASTAVRPAVGRRRQIIRSILSGDQAVAQDRGRWRELIRRARRPVPVAARTPLRPFAGVSDAVAMDCDDGRRYVVKGRQVGRALVADQVVGRLGDAIRAPVAEVGIVDVPAQLVAESPYLEPFEPGVGHGSLFIPGCHDSRDVAFAYEQENEERFALLAVLYGWALADDRQFLYQKTPPRLVHSVDHGNFFAGGPEWTIDTLATAPVAEPDTWIAIQAGTRGDALRAAIAQLRSVADAGIAEAVAAPPGAWGVSMDERVALAEYLAHRRDELLARLPAG